MTPTETKALQNSPNPLLSIEYEPALESLGDDYYDEVAAAEFPQHILRWRNDDLLPQLGLDPKEVMPNLSLILLRLFLGRNGEDYTRGFCRVYLLPRWIMWRVAWKSIIPKRRYSDLRSNLCGSKL